MEVRREDPRIVRLRIVTQRPAPCWDDLGIDFARPDDGELLPLSVVVNAREIGDRGRVWGEANVLHEVRASSHPDKGPHAKLGGFGGHARLGYSTAVYRPECCLMTQSSHHTGRS